VRAHIENELAGVTDGLTFVQNYDGIEHESDDAVQLRQILQQLALAKDDSQQRSWFLHEDEPAICQHLHDIISILVCMPIICIHFFNAAVFVAAAFVT
jgi:hypothetical protein